jgi:Leucine-rich repeat (LRR) protein
MEYTPNKIYKDFLKKNLDLHSATKLLLSLIENSDNDKIRVKSIKELGRIGSKDKHTFRILENLLISDSNENIRNSAAFTLKNNFLDNILEPMKWALIHEESPSCLNTIYFTLIKIIKKYVKDSNPLAKSTLLNEVKKIMRKEFKIGFEVMCETKDVDSFTKKDLSEILINYFTIIFLEKSHWRLKYKIENCKITELDFIFKGITSVPEPIKYLVQLNILILRYNQLIRLPDWIGSLNALEELNINVNNLNKLPNSMGMLSSLKKLYLWKNELDSLPNTIGQLSSLEILNLRLNQLKELPKSIENLSSLKELDLHDNQLKSIPESLKNLKSLEKLHLSWNNIEKLPDSIGDLPSLVILDLERNELVDLPDSVGHLSSLEFLNLSDNKLKKLPDSIGNLLNLRYLNLSRNEINFLPKSIKSLKSLEELYLGENDLKMNPKSLKDLEKNGVKIHYF